MKMCVCSVILFFVSLEIVRGIQICRTDCMQRAAFSGADFSSFHIHCIRLFGFGNTGVTKPGAQEWAIKKTDLLKGCSANSRLIVRDFHKDVCVENKGRAVTEYSRLLLVSSQSFLVDLKTRVVSLFSFKWTWIRAVAYLKNVDRFLISLRDEIITTPITKMKKVSIRRNIAASKLVVDEEEELIFLKLRAFKTIFSMNLNGTNLTSLNIFHNQVLLFDVDTKDKVIYAFQGESVASFTYGGRRLQELLHLDTLNVLAVDYDPVHDALYYCKDSKIMMVTMNRNKHESIFQAGYLHRMKSLEVQGNYMYISLIGMGDAAYVIDLTSHRLEIIRVRRIYGASYQLLLF